MHVNSKHKSHIVSQVFFFQESSFLCHENYSVFRAAVQKNDCKAQREHKTRLNIKWLYTYIYVQFANTQLFIAIPSLCYVFHVLIIFST